jgi:hypothetical protein
MAETRGDALTTEQTPPAGRKKDFQGQARLSPLWRRRAEFAARFVKPGVAILDVGCGEMWVERTFKPSRYIPVDLTSRDERTRVIDLDEAELPAEWLAEAELVVMLGLLEYLEDPARQLAAVARAGRPLLCSYNTMEYSADLDERRRHGWVMDVDIEGFEQLVRRLGFRVVSRHIYADSQPIWLLVPGSADARTVLRFEEERLPAGAAPTPAPASALAPGRSKLCVAGFFGRGNCGDEAILQAIYETFAADYDIVLSVDERGAYDGFWNWYPYTHCRIVHQADMGGLVGAPRPAGLIVGGGGIFFSFAGNQAMAAQWAKVPCVMAGVDLLADPETLASARIDWQPFTRYVNTLAFYAPRHEVAPDVASRLGVNPFHGADWALRLPADESPDVPARPDAVAIVLREYDLPRVRYDYIEAVKRLVEGLRVEGRTPLFLPFSPEDERFLGELAIGGLAPVERQWWNPRRMKQLVGSVGAVVSCGRLHPLVFAASTRTPVIETRLPVAGIAGPRRKLDAMNQELGIASSPDVDDTLDRFAAGTIRASDEARLRASEQRLEAMIARIKAVFGPP